MNIHSLFLKTGSDLGKIRPTRCTGIAVTVLSFLSLGRSLHAFQADFLLPHKVPSRDEVLELSDLSRGWGLSSGAPTRYRRHLAFPEEVKHSPQFSSELKVLCQKMSTLSSKTWGSLDHEKHLVLENQSHVNHGALTDGSPITV